MFDDMLVSWVDLFLIGIGSLPFIILVLIAVIHMIASKNDIKKNLFGWPFIILLVLFNPITVYVLSQKFYSEDRIDRLAWYLPMVFGTIIFLVDYIYIEKKSLKTWIVITICSVLIIDIISFSINIYDDDRGNIYLMPQKYINVGKIFDNEDNTKSYVVVSDDSDLTHYLRRYLPNIKLIDIDSYVIAEKKTLKELYGDRYESFIFITNYNEDEKDFQEIKEALEKLNVEYLVLTDGSRFESVLECYDSKFIGETDEYRVFKLW